MRQPPRRKRVGRKTLMHQRQRRLGQRIAQVGVKAFDLMRQQQALVHDRARRERRHVEIAQALAPLLAGEFAHAVERLLADRQDLALEGVLIGDRRVADDDGLADRRHGFDDAGAEAARVGWHVAPAEHRLAFDFHEALEMLDGDGLRLFLARQETHGDGIMPGRRQDLALLRRPIAQQRVRNLNQTAGAVADQGIGADRAAMIQVEQDLQAAADDVVRLSALDVHDEADAASVVLVAGVVKSLSLRQAHRTHPEFNRPCPGRFGARQGADRPL